MESRPPAQPASARVAPKARRGGMLKSAWRRIRKPLAQSRLAKGTLASLLSGGLRLVRATSPVVPGSTDLAQARDRYSPAIIALWHGQHLMAPTVYPKGVKLAAMVSRSADAELNALVIEKFGFRAVRGSGGRSDSNHMEKGGATALVALKKLLDEQWNVCMIADIPHGTPRDAGMGIVTLGRLSGRPILPTAIATSRRRVLDRSWDKTTINLPFGRTAVVVGEPVWVESTAGPEALEAARVELTQRLNVATARAYELADGGR
jgi:lysophospholipid acyltransferase (LPLAT)-like uncharacterized protein